jgi:hypothetical protein
LRTLLVLVVVALAAGAAHAQDRLDALAAAVDRAAGTPRGEAAIVERMAAALALTPERVRVARVETRLGWGDLFIAHRMAARGGHPLEKVLAARRTNTGWTEIAEEGRVDPGARGPGDAAAGARGHAGTRSGAGILARAAARGPASARGPEGRALAHPAHPRFLPRPRVRAAGSHARDALGGDPGADDPRRRHAPVALLQ